MATRWSLALVLLIGMGLATTAWGDEVAVDPPLRLTVAPEGGERMRGWLTAYDEAGFTLKPAEGGDAEHVAWDSLRPDRVMGVQEKLLSRDDARGWYTLGAMLFGREDGQALAEKAFRRALSTEPDLASKIDRIRQGEAVAYDEPDPEPEAPGHGGHNHGGGDAAEGGGQGGPVTLGDLQTQFWGELSDELMESSIDELKNWMKERQEQMNHRLRLYEDASDYFLLYSDLPPKEARQWAGLLDDMYDRLVKIFGLERGRNIFRGRGLIVVFRNELDYHRYMITAYGYQGSQGTAGLCISRGDGHVEVVFFKQRNELNFARVLVHEAVHAFNHRYRSHPHLVSWINEGLAEHVASGLVDRSGFGESDFAGWVDQGIRDLRNRKTLGGNSFFYASHIDSWQYPVAHLLTSYMIRQDGKRYREFINAIKDGKHWEEALVEDYGVELETLVDAFGRSLNIRGLQP